MFPALFKSGNWHLVGFKIFPISFLSGLRKARSLFSLECESVKTTTACCSEIE